MFNKKIIFILTIILVLLFAVSAVSAADNTTSDVVSVDETTEDVISIEENQVIEQTDNDDVIGVNDAGTFTALQKKINSASEGSTITLENDYNYDDGFSTDGITITKSITIDGNGHTINGLSKSKIFKLTYGEKNFGRTDSFQLTVKNVIFLNGNGGEYGGAIQSTRSTFYGERVTDIYSYSWGMDISNCIFTGNKAKWGGAIDHTGSGDVIITNSTFTSNEASYGGATRGGNFHITNCVFISNNATDGGAVSSGSELELNGCSFLYNEASDRGGAAIGGVNAVNCIFTSNTAKSGGAVWSSQEQSISGCEFTSNHASSKGGAVYFDSTGRSGSSTTYYTNLIEDSTFKSNTAESDGGAIYAIAGTIGGKRYGGYAERCIFSNNKGEDDDGVYGTVTVDCIFKANIVIDAADLTKYYGSSEKFTIRLTKDNKALSNVDVKITVNGKTSTVTTDSNGRASLDLNLPVGTHNVLTEYGSDSTTSNVTVKSTVTANDASGTFSNSKVTATFLNTAGKALASRQVTFKIGTASYSATTNSNGVASANIPLGVGTYTVTAVNPANNEQKTFKLTISKADSKIALTSTQSNGVTTLTATLTPTTASGNVVFNVNGENKNAVISNGKAILTLKDLEPGNYIVTASYNGDNNLKASTSNTVTFNVAEVYPILTAKNLTKTYGTSNKFVVNLVDSKGNAIANAVVNVNINNKVTPITTGSDGKATMPITLAPATYTATITYKNDATTTAKIVVKKATPKMTASAKTYKVKATKKYTVTLKDNQNKVMKNTKVTLQVNGKTYSAKTNTKGIATFTLKLTKKGKFTATVKYAGSKYYNAKTVKPKITVK